MLKLSDELEPFRKEIERSAKKYMRLRLEKQNDDLGLTDTKFGGLPYLPKGNSFPVDAEGNPLMLVAQFNFEQLEPIPHFPERGVLQFFVGMDNLYGLDLDNPLQQNGFRVIYYPDAEDELETDFSFFLNYVSNEKVHQPLNKQFELSSELRTGFISDGDVNFKLFLHQDVEDFYKQFGKQEELIEEEFEDISWPTGHKLGGYPFFVQDDPRFSSQEFSDYDLLFQIDSDDDNINWGDVGVANFFIRRDDLRKRDFSRVLYNWDCS
jgi:uncharacterized protein YwqG